MNKKRFVSVIMVVALLFSQTTTVGAKTKKKKATTKAITISAAGDCTLGIDPYYPVTGFDSVYNAHGKKYFFKKVQSVFKKDDLTLVNFEGALTNSSNRRDKAFTFKGKPAYAAILKAGSIEAVNLANNHTYDFGVKGYTDTKKYLKKQKILFSGGSTVAIKKVKGIKIGMVGVNALESNASGVTKQGINIAKKKGAKIIIVSFHWGIEYESYPNSNQKNLAHYAIDQGADLVVGHHPHIMQGIEKYKGAYIAYSLGNFCFGGNSNPEDKDTMIFSQTFYVKGKKLQKKRTTKVIPCSLSSVSSYNNYQPRILKGSAKKRVQNKINRLSKPFDMSFSVNGKAKK